MKKVLDVTIIMLIVFITVFWISINTNEKLATQLGLASGPGKPNTIDNAQPAEQEVVVDGDLLSEPTEDLSEIPGGTTHVVDIWDRTKTESILCGSALEKFWEDETNEYYFACIKSQYIIVMDSTGKTVDVVTALNEGLITIETLDSYGIKYDTRPKS